MEDDFIFEEEEETSEGTSNRQFLTLAGILGTVLVIASICTVSFLLINRNGTNATNAAAIAEIETRNAAVAVTNEAVTQTIAAMETEAAEPTATPTIPPTNTPLPTETPTPTDTPVVQEATTEEGSEEGENESGESSTDATDGSTDTSGEATTSGEGSTTDETTTDSSESGSDSSSTGATDGSTIISGQGETPTPIAATSNSSNAETLPQTGIETWSTLLIALALIATFIVARRLRSV